MKKNNIKISERGFTLVEVLIATAIMSLGALALSELMGTQFKSVKTIESSSEVIGLLNGVRTIISSSDSCEETFVRNPANGGNPYSYNQVALSNPMPIRKISKSTGTVTSQFIANSDVNSAEAYGNGNVKILSYTLDDSHSSVGIPAGETIGTTHLIVEFYRGKAVLGQSTIKKKILLNVERVSPGDNRIQTCSTAAESVGLAVAVCSSLDGNYVQGSPDVCELQDYRELVTPAHNLLYRAVSENYLKDLFMLGDTGVTELQVGDDQYADDFTVNAETRINGWTYMSSGTSITTGPFSVTGSSDFHGPSFFHGDITVVNPYTITMNSDKNLKYDIADMPNQIEKVRKVRPVEFKWKSNNKKSLGFIAQEIKEHYPQFVTQDPKTKIHSVNYIQLISVTFKALQELDQKIEVLKDEVINISEENRALRKEIKRIKKP